MEWYNHYDVWNYKRILYINGKKLTFSGHSIAAEKSGFYIHELKLFLDAGLQSPFSPKYIFITHGHTDHSFALPMLIKAITTTPDIYVPVGTSQFYKQFINATEHMSHNCNEYYDILTNDCTKKRHYQLHDFTNDILLDNKMIVKKIQTFHSVVSNGYCFFETRTHLKKEYLPPFPTDSLIALKKEFENKTDMENMMYDKTLHPMFVYTGDTSIKVFDDIIFDTYQFPYIITECTFVHAIDKDISLLEKATQFGHIDFSQLLEIIIKEKFKNTTFILTHFSARYTLSQVTEYISKYELNNVIIWPN
jgi:ribonuclease BN (tRNA processing enzyme)